MIKITQKSKNKQKKAKKNKIALILRNIQKYVT
jgi:hypothetical protein